MGVCTKEDGYIYELFEFNPRWVVKLSNGETVFQDDNRPGEEEHSAWIRLAKYMQENRLDIEHMKLQFRSNVKVVNDGPVDGFFFSQASLGAPGMKTVDYFVAGTLKNGILQIRRWQVPELELDEVEYRKVADAKECLIINPSFTYGK